MILIQIVQALEPDEAKGEIFGTVNSTVSSEDWEQVNNKIKHHVIVIPDQTANVKNEELIYTILRMRMCINEGGSVYVHCYAGRGRSAMLCAIYLAVFGPNPNSIEEMTLEQAIQHLKSIRKQVKLHDCQKEKANLIINELKQLMKHNVINDAKKVKPESKDVKAAPSRVAKLPA